MESARRGFLKLREKIDLLFKQGTLDAGRRSQLLSKHFELTWLVRCQKALVQQHEAQVRSFEVKLVATTNTILARDVSILALESSRTTNRAYWGAVMSQLQDEAWGYGFKEGLELLRDYSESTLRPIPTL